MKVSTIKYRALYAVSILTIIIVINSCTKDVGKLSYADTGFPEDVGKIIIEKCATSGCHNDLSKGAAAGLGLASWNRMFEGSNGGAVVIPYRPDLSTIIYYTNSYSEYGTIQLIPKMPLAASPLSNAEVKTLYDWISNGAPNAQGQVKFYDNPNRRKFYVSNQGCDIVYTFDANSMLAMGATNVGKVQGAVEAPHFVRVSPDNKYWYVSFLGAPVVQKYSVRDNSFISEANVGYGSWNTFVITSDGKYIYAIDWSNSGKIKKIQTDSMIVRATLGGLIWPHGSALNEANDTLYVTSQIGNYIFKIPTDLTSYQQIILDNSPFPSNSSILNPHEVLMSPDFTKYFVTCEKSNQIKVVSRATDQVLATIPVGDVPQEMAISKTKNYLFVSCMEDITTYGNTKRGSVYIIDIATHAVIGHVYTGHQPHGVMVDEQNKRVYVTNRNVISGGPAPHHASLCTGRNGYVTVIDLNTLKLIEELKAEVSVDPYGYSIMH